MTILFYKKKKPLNIITISFITLAFSLNSIILSPNAQSQNVSNLPPPGTMISLSSPHVPIMLKGMKIYPQQPFRMDFIIDSGDENMDDATLKKESAKLIKYFLAALTVPEEDLWVNLSPYEKNRIIPKRFSVTEMGRDLLSQDYILKQLTSSLMSPEDNLGEIFWDKIYQKAYQMYGTTEVPVNTFNKVWIMPDTATLYENLDVVYIVDSHLKTMLQEDYLALRKNKETEINQRESKSSQKLNNITSSLIKETILPDIEQEVNKGRGFSQLRQIYNSLILAIWFKRNLRRNLLNQSYVNKNKVKGIDLNDKQITEKIYQQYVISFKKGVYNFIKEDYDPVTQKIIPRKYFSGGFFGVDQLNFKYVRDPHHSTLSGKGTVIKVDLFETIVQKLKGLANHYSWDKVYDFLETRKNLPNNSDQEKISDVLKIFEKSGIPEKIIEGKANRTYLWDVKESRLHRKGQMLGGILLKQKNNAQLKIILPRENFLSKNLTLENLGYFLHELTESTLLEAGVLKEIAHQEALHINNLLASSPELSIEEGLKLSSDTINEILNKLESGQLEKGSVAVMRKDFQGIVGAMHQSSEDHLEKVKELKESEKSYTKTYSDKDAQWYEYYQKLLKSNLDQAHNFLKKEMEARRWHDGRLLDNARFGYFDALIAEDNYDLAFDWLLFLMRQADGYWGNSIQVKDRLEESLKRFIDTASLFVWWEQISEHLESLDNTHSMTSIELDELWLYLANELKKRKRYSQLNDLFEKFLANRSWYYDRDFQEFQLEALKSLRKSDLDAKNLEVLEKMLVHFEAQSWSSLYKNQIEKTKKRIEEGEASRKVSAAKEKKAKVKIQISPEEKSRRKELEQFVIEHQKAEDLKEERRKKYGDNLKKILRFQPQFFKVQNQGQSPFKDNPFVNLDSTHHIVDANEIDLFFIYRQAISIMAENGYVLENISIPPQSDLQKMANTETQIVIIPGLRDEIIEIYNEQLSLKGFSFESYDQGKFSFAAESPVTYIMEVGRIFNRTKHIIIDEQDYNNFQNADKKGAIWEAFIRKASGNIRGKDTKLNRKIFKIVYGGRERKSFSNLLDVLPDAPEARGGLSYLVDKLAELKQSMGIDTPRTIYDLLPASVAAALKLTRLARLESFSSDTFKAWSIGEFSSEVKRRYDSVKKNSSLPINDLTSSGGWIQALHDIFKSWSDVEDKVNALRNLLKEATIEETENPMLRQMVAETIAFVKTEGILPDISEDDVYLFPDGHVIQDANLPASLGAPSGGNYFFLYDTKYDKSLEVFSASVDATDPIAVAEAFLILAHELTHGKEHLERLNARPYGRPYDYPAIVDSAGSIATHNVLTEGAAVHFTDRIALPLLYTTTPGINAVKEIMLKEYKKKNPKDIEMSKVMVDQLTHEQIDQLYHWFTVNAVLAVNYQQRTEMIDLVEAKYGEDMIENFFFKKDFDEMREDIGHLFPFINMFILSRSDYKLSQIDGIKNEFWNGHAFYLIVHLLAKPYYDELDFFIDLLGLLGRDSHSNWEIDYDWVKLEQSEGWRGSPTNMFKESATQRHFVRQKVLKALMRDLGKYLDPSDESTKNDEAMTTNMKDKKSFTSPTGGIDLDASSLKFKQKGPGMETMEFSFPYIMNPCLDDTSQICDQLDFQDFEILPVEGLTPIIWGIDHIISLVPYLINS